MMIKCPLCDKEIKETQKFIVYGEHTKVAICRDCFKRGVEKGEIFYCDIHKRWEKRQKIDVIKGNKIISVCDDVRYDDYLIKKCSICGNLYITNKRDNHICCMCAVENNMLPISEKIHSYHNSKNKIHPFLGNKNEDLFFGYEIESEFSNRFEETGNDRIEAVLDIDEEVRKLFFFENDGSLNYGFETISYPMSYEFMRNNKAIERIIDGLKQNMIVTNRCGLHIHVSKTNKVNKKMPQIIMFFENNKEFFEKISNRSENRYADFYSSRDAKLTLNDAKIIFDNKEAFERYHVINLKNDNTIEFRLFAGTLDSKRIIAYTQLILTLLDMDIKEDTPLCEIRKNASDEFVELIDLLDSMYIKDTIELNA